jgi:hypothetical protein
MGSEGATGGVHRENKFPVCSELERVSDFRRSAVGTNDMGLGCIVKSNPEINAEAPGRVIARGVRQLCPRPRINRKVRSKAARAIWNEVRLAAVHAMVLECRVHRDFLVHHPANAQRQQETTHSKS